MTLNFNLRQSKSDKPTPIYAVYYNGSKQVYKSTGVKVKPSQWNKKHQAAIIGAKMCNLDKRNNKLVNQTLANILNLYKEDITVMTKDIKRVKDLLAAARKDPNITESTKKQYEAKLKPLLQFVGERTELDTIATEEFFSKFQTFLLSDKCVVKSKSKDFVNQTLRNLNILLGKCGYSPINYTRLKQAKTYQPFLYNSEVMQLYRFKAPTPKLEEVKNLFVLACLIGQRKSDLSELRVEDSCYSVIQKKTNTRVSVPFLFKLAKELIKSDIKIDSKINRYLKQVGKLAGLDRKVPKEISSSTEYVPLYERIHIHTARHTFDYLCKVNLNMDSSKIAKFAGHSASMVEAYCKEVTAADYEKAKQDKEAGNYVWGIEDTTTKNELFAYDTVSAVMACPVEDMAAIKRAIRVILTVPTKKHYEIVKESEIQLIDKFCWKFGKRFASTKLYRMFQYKCNLVGHKTELIDEDLLSEIWQQEIREEEEKYFSDEAAAERHYNKY